MRQVVHCNCMGTENESRTETERSCCIIKCSSMFSSSIHLCTPASHSSQSRICAPQHNIERPLIENHMSLAASLLVSGVNKFCTSYILLLLSDTVTGVRNERNSSRLVLALPKGREQTSLNIWSTAAVREECGNITNRSGFLPRFF